MSKVPLYKTCRVHMACHDAPDQTQPLWGCMHGGCVDNNTGLPIFSSCETPSGLGLFPSSETLIDLTAPGMHAPGTRIGVSRS